MEYPFLEHSGILAFAHRGGAKERQENTMAAFQNAIDLGFRYLETDARATKDGVLLAFHDATLDRLTDKIGLVEELDYSEVKQARIDGDYDIPLLADVLRSWPEIRVNIDPKHDGAVVPLIKMIKDLDVEERVCIGSFSGERVDAVRDAFEQKVCTAMSPFEITRLRLASFAGALAYPSSSIRAGCIQAPKSFRGVPVVTEAFVQTAESYGLQIHVWTVDDTDDMQALLDMGIHGIMTDRPRILRDFLVKSGRWTA